MKAASEPRACREWRIAFERYLDGAWSARSEMIESGETGAVAPPTDELLRHAEVCPHCTERLHRGMDLLRASEQTIETPPQLAQRIRESLPGSRPLQFRRLAVLAAAAAAILVVVFVVPWSASAPDRSMEIVFHLEAPNARQVVLVGDWNGWDSGADPLTDRDGDGVWETTIRLVPGTEYRYQFLIDGERWVADPKSPLIVDDGFGGFNSILQL